MAPKVFVYALEGEPETLDPAGRFYSERAIRVKWLLYDCLVNISGDGRQREAGLAERWTVSEDGLRVEMTIRDGVLFHDGTHVDSHTVKWCFERQFKTDLTDPSKRLLRDLIEDIRVPDERTLVFQLKYPGFEYLGQRYLYKLAVVSPKAVDSRGEQFERNPIGTGPFMNPEWLPDKIVVHKNPAYWAGAPKIDEVHFPYIPDGREAMKRLLTGNVDFIPSLSDPDSIEELLHDDRVRVRMVPGFNVFYLGFHCTKPPFNNAAMRQAVVRAIDIHKMALIGKGASLPAGGPFPPHMQAYDSSVRQPAYDPQGAKELLKQAGHDRGPLTLLHYGPASYARNLALAVERDLCEIGLTVSRQPVPTWPEFLKAAQKAEADMFVYSWHMRTDDAHGFLRALFHSSNIGNTNLTGYSNPEVDRLLDQPPPHQFSAVMRKVIVDAPMVFLSHWTRVAAHKTRVRGLRLNVGVLPQDKLVGVDLGP